MLSALVCFRDGGVVRLVALHLFKLKLIESVEESYRQWGPTITEPEWDRLLRDSGFNGIDFALRDYDDPKDHHVSFLVSTADGVSNRQETTSDVVIVTSSTNPQTQLVAQLQNQLHASGYGLASTASFGSLTHGTISRKALLFVADLARPVLPGIENETFSMLQMMLTSAASVLWLSPGSTLAGSAPDSGLIVGLGRVVRAERNGFKFITLQLSEQPQGDFMMRTQCLAGVLRVFNESASRSQGAMGESEYSEKDGTIYINRLVQAPQFNDVMSATYSARKARLQPFGGDRDIPQQALKLEISAPGLLSTLRFVEDEMYHETLPDSSIEIEVTAVGLNFRDVMIAMGQLSDTYLGDECAGVIRRVGSAVKSFQVGDRVFGVAHGSLRTYYRDEARLFQKIPEGMSFESAAALPLVYCTAYYGLMYRAGLQRGQSVLIHAAAGGVGQAAIVLAKRVGAEVFVTVGTTDKKDFVQQEYGISEDHIFYSRDLSFAKGVRRMTHGRGVDVVLNSLSGEALRLSWQCVAPFGTFVELGRRDIDAHSRLDLDPFIKNVTFTSVNYAILLDINKPLASKLFSEVVELASQDEISPAKELTVYPYSQLEDAFRNLQGGKHIGKIILKSSQEDLVNVSPHQCSIAQ
jgi:NADPH:quinone reductase-like Zn-dependent oxidoreductase